jgi:uncharacterized FlaG/YvyC family protein
MEIQGVEAAGAASQQQALAASSTPASQAGLPADQPAAGQPQGEHQPLTAAIGHLFGAAEKPDVPQNPVQISYRSAGSQGIVTVLTDRTSGKEVAEFPTQILLDMATFFDQQSGVTLDREA